MKKFNEMYVIGIDHGYGNMKTAKRCLYQVSTALTAKYDVATEIFKNFLQFICFLQRDIYWTLDILELGWRVRNYA